MIKPFFKKFITSINQDQKGATLLISALILALLTVFVATALVNSTSSTISINNDANTKNSFYASYAALEKMSKEFSDIFTANLSPTPAQLNTIKANAEALSKINNPSTGILDGVKLTTDIRKGDFVSSGVDLTNGPYSGLKALREEYVFTSTGVTNTGVTVQLTRSLYNNLIPIFQFGIFSTRHLEFYNGPPFNFGGRVHANKDIYLTPGGTTTFADRVTTVGQITYGMARNGVPRAVAGGTVKIFFPPISGTVNLNLGSVNNGPNTVGDPRPGHPTGTTNFTAFDNFIKTNLPGQVFVKAPVLKLPIQNTNNNPIEIIRRGLPGETYATSILAQSRFYNKAGLRITISDTQAQLPGGAGGVRLDSDRDPSTNVIYADNRLGYKPKPLGGYQASRINGHRLKGWIKIETVLRQADGTLLENDVTEAVLALGVTKYENGADKGDVNALGTGLTVPTGAGISGFGAGLTNYSTLDDSKSVICLQRYSIAASGAIGRSDGGVAGTLANGAKNNLVPAPGTPGAIPTITDPVANSFPLVDNVANSPQNSDTPPIIYSGGTLTVPAIATGTKANLLTSGMLIPYPINTYDQREGGALDSTPGAPNASNVHLNGVISVVDVNMGNLKKLLTGGYDVELGNGGFSFRASNIPSETNGWIIYFSDRRGDTFDPTGVALATKQLNNYGKYDMETNYGNTTSVVSGKRRPYIPSSSPTVETLFEIEDVNDNGTIEFPNDINATAINTEGALPDEYMDVVDALTKGPWHPNTRSDNTSSFTSTGDIFLSGNNNRTRVRLDNNTQAIQVPLFRRSLRLYNGMDLTNSGTNTVLSSQGLNLNRGITFASENPVFVLGNYNTKGVKFPTGTTANTAADFDYSGTMPIASTEVPAAIISDSVTLLSNNWRDAVGFTSPYTLAGRVASNTQYRVAVFTGRTRDGLFAGANDTVKWGTIGTSGTVGPEQDDVRLYGGVHNFLRYIENWGSLKLSYCGSIIDGWDSYQANGVFKCCATVYSPPTRDYTYNTAFQSVDRLPPGTPNLQYILFTNFRENVNPKQY